MRAVLVMLGAVAMLVGVAVQPANAGKATDFDRFLKRIQKFAVDDTFAPKPRGLCVCQDGSLYHTQVGVLVYSGQLGDGNVTVWCHVRGFNSEGVNDFAQLCNTFEVLSK
jgi:hypothetical protein